MMDDRVSIQVVLMTIEIKSKGIEHIEESIKDMSFIQYAIVDIDKICKRRE